MRFWNHTCKTKASKLAVANIINFGHVSCWIWTKLISYPSWHSVHAFFCFLPLRHVPFVARWHIFVPHLVFVTFRSWTLLLVAHTGLRQTSAKLGNPTPSALGFTFGLACSARLYTKSDSARHTPLRPAVDLEQNAGGDHQRSVRPDERWERCDEVWQGWMRLHELK